MHVSVTKLEGTVLSDQSYSLHQQQSWVSVQDHRKQERVTERDDEN